MKLAIFDIDGTLLAGSTERMFWRYLARRGCQGLPQILAYSWRLLRDIPAHGVHAVKRDKAYLAGLDVAEIERLAEVFVSERIIDALRPDVVARLRQHADDGDAVVLLSGTLDAIARPLGDRLAATRVSATRCTQSDGRFLARPPEIHPFGAAKLRLAREIAAALGLDLGAGIAYADSIHDLRLLEAVGRPVAVRPDARLLGIARERRWEIMPAGESPDLRPYSIS